MPKWMLNLVEFVGLCLLVAGVSMLSVAAALVVAGLALMLACEVRG